jgi:hydroxymethylglutaryl-CoA lyase
MNPASLSPALPRRVVVREMGLRDGLQSVATIVPTAAKIEWLRDAYAAGQREIEVGSFVPPRLLPQLADTAEVLAFAQTLPGLRATVLVPNLKGRSARWKPGEMMLLPLSASHAHSLANLRKTPDEVLAEIGRIRAERDASGARTQIEVGISTAFGCTIQGEVAPQEVVRLVQAALDAGVEAVSLADTVGYADPGHGVAPVRARAAAWQATSRVRPLPRHPRAGPGERLRRPAAGHRPLRCLHGRHRRLPASPGRERQRRHRRPHLHAAQHGHRHRASDFDRPAGACAPRVVQGWRAKPTHGTIWKVGLPRTRRRKRPCLRPARLPQRERPAIQSPQPLKGLRWSNSPHGDGAHLRHGARRTWAPK